MSAAAAAAGNCRSNQGPDTRPTPRHEHQLRWLRAPGAPPQCRAARPRPASGDPAGGAADQELRTPRKEGSGCLRASAAQRGRKRKRGDEGDVGR